MQPSDPTLSPDYVGRLAPAPTGALHPGNARTFLVAWLRARRAGGRLILRLEDLDHPKVKPDAAGEVYRDLAWLGLNWDAGPRASFFPADASGTRGDKPDASPRYSASGFVSNPVSFSTSTSTSEPASIFVSIPVSAPVPAPVPVSVSIPHFDSAQEPDPSIQSHRLGLYAGILETLRQRGLVYPCICTRKELDSVLSAPNAGEDLHERRYPGTCRDRFADAAAARAASGREPGWRFRVEEGTAIRFVDGFQGVQEGALAEWSGDFLIARGDAAGYQLAVVVDDHAMGVTEVVRGDDLLPSAQRQLALYQALTWTPPRFFHLPLVTGPDGRRLAKRHGDTRLSLLRQNGQGPERLLGWLAWSCGWLEEKRACTLAEIIARCDFAAIPRGKALLTREDARWIGFPG